MENDFFMNNNSNLSENVQLYNDNFERLKMEEYIRLKNHQENLLKEINSKIEMRNAQLENKILLNKGATEWQVERDQYLEEQNNHIKNKVTFPNKP